jgi:hypothetical protein
MMHARIDISAKQADRQQETRGAATQHPQTAGESTQYKQLQA